MPLRDSDLQLMYRAVLANLPSQAKLFFATSIATAFTSTAGEKQAPFNCNIEFQGVQRWFNETTEEYIPISMWQAKIPKYVNPQEPTTENDYGTSDQFWALGYIFRVESVETPESWQLYKLVNLRWSGATSATAYGTYSFEGEAPFDALQDQLDQDILVQDGNEAIFV